MIPSTLHGLTELFQKLGAPDPKSHATSQLQENPTTLHRFLFLREAWRLVVPEDDSAWIKSDLQVAEEEPDESYAGAGLAIASLRAKGATDEELTDLVRAKQAELLFGFCYLLADPNLKASEGVAEVGWMLVERRPDGSLGAAIDCLHESVLESDPTGREMRPRGK